MARTRMSDEQKTAIIEEYQTAVTTGRGGGAEVAKKHGIPSTLINGWMRARSKEGANGKRRRAPPAQDFVAGLDRLIAYHEGQVGKLRKIREDYEE